MDGLLLIALCALGAFLGKMQSAARDVGRMDPVTGVVQASTTPISRLVESSADGVSDFFYGLFRARRLALENQRLHDRLASLALYTETSTRLQRDIDNLRTTLRLPNYGRIKVSADIVGYQPRASRLTISAGAAQGIKPGMPVVASLGLVGIVQTVSREESQLLLLTSNDLNNGNGIGAIVMNRNPSPAGLLKGETATTLDLSFNDPKAPVQIGDTVGTSGFGIIPRGIPIGKVIQVQDDPAYGERRAIVDPFVSLGELREVVVLR